MQSATLITTATKSSVFTPCDSPRKTDGTIPSTFGVKRMGEITNPMVEYDSVAFWTDCK